MKDTIYRQAAIDALEREQSHVERPITETRWFDLGLRKAQEVLSALPSAQPEQLTDKEQRIFLAAMGREEKICKQVDDEHRDCREPYEDSLMWVCKEIRRKVKGALWS